MGVEEAILAEVEYNSGILSGSGSDVAGEVFTA